jgi:hypothetical protein
MLENFIFENHLGQRFDGLANGVYLNANELRDYSWEYDVINNRISRFYRSPVQRKLPLLISCKTSAEAVTVKNRLLELAEADIDAMLPGKIYVGEYYTTGYITASKKSQYRITGRYCEIELTLTSAEPSWSRESTHVFGGSQDTVRVDRSGVDFPFDYPHDYSVSTTSRQILCDAIRSNKFKLRIYGEAVNPTVIINGHVYKVNGTIRAGEVLVIDSLNKTITLTTASGTKINWFNNRSREAYIFEPIPPGLSTVLYNGAFQFDLIIIEERSEPKWI